MYCLRNIKRSVVTLFLLIHSTKTSLVTMSSTPNSCTIRKIRVLAFDFDKTCTKRSVLDIYKAREDYTNDGELKTKALDAEWEKLINIYFEITKSVSVPKLEDLEAVSTFDTESLRRYLRKWGEADTLASKEVINSNILKGITKAGLQQFAKHVELMPNLLDVLRSFKFLNLPLHVISLNLSEKLIEEVLNRRGTLPLVVHANKLVFENGVTTGNMQENFLTAFDKEVEFKKIVQSAEDRCGLTIYIGDSYNDLLALLEADVGFIIGNSKTMLQSCHYFGIQVTKYQYSTVEARLKKLGTEQLQPLLFLVQSWDEIKEFVLNTK